MVNYRETIKNFYNEREKFIILGLTGRTGSGCTTTANILSQKDYKKLDLQYKNYDDELDLHDINTDKIKFDVVNKYLENRWEPFTVIEGSSIILSYLFETEDIKYPKSKTLINYLDSLQTSSNQIYFKIDNYSELKDKLMGLDYIYESVEKLPLKKIDSLLLSGEKVEDDTIESYYKLYITGFKNYKERIKKILLQHSCYEQNKSKRQDSPAIKYHLYTYLFQKFGNNIRSSGNIYSSEFKNDAYLQFAKRISALINLTYRYNISKDLNTRICIDAIRNPYEALYLSQQYKSFLLISINIDDDERTNRLLTLNKEERDSLDKVEYPSKLSSEEQFYHQDIGKCLELADIHLNNSINNGGIEKYFFLTQ